MENVSEYYYQKLKTTTNPATVISSLYKDVTNITPGRPEIIMFNKLIKLFGRFTVFLAVMDLSGIENIEGTPYGLLYKICKNRLEKISQVDMTAPVSVNLSKLSEALVKDYERVKKTKIDIEKILEDFDGTE